MVSLHLGQDAVGGAWRSRYCLLGSGGGDLLGGQGRHGDLDLVGVLVLLRSRQLGEGNIQVPTFGPVVTGQPCLVDLFAYFQARLLIRQVDGAAMLPEDALDHLTGGLVFCLPIFW